MSWECPHEDGCLGGCYSVEAHVKFKRQCEPLEIERGTYLMVMGTYYCFSCGGSINGYMTANAVKAGERPHRAWDFAYSHAGECQPVSRGEIETALDRIRQRLAARRAERAIPSGLPPRYDEVYFEGVKWLDALANE
jgi:hypothetical protein